MQLIGKRLGRNPRLSSHSLGFPADQPEELFLPTCPALFSSTLDDGKIVKGLAGVPDEGPVLFTGYHTLMGLEIYSLVEEFLKENIMVRGVAHPDLFSQNFEDLATEFSVSDWMKVMGAVPVIESSLRFCCFFIALALTMT
ncbi:hypothetical protein OIU78_027651 [Salix suchowensis]|nr:hypothetical protein OIU78_027651 [Salix suchowensis]